MIDKKEKDFFDELEDEFEDEIEEKQEDVLENDFVDENQIKMNIDEDNNVSIS